MLQESGVVKGKFIKAGAKPKVEAPVTKEFHTF